MSFRKRDRGHRDRDWGRGYDRKRQRDSYENRGPRHVDPEAEVQSRLDSLIIRLGDKTAANLDDNLAGLATALEHDILRHSDRIIATVLNCVAELGTKTGVYATLIGLLNAEEKNNVFCEQFTNALSLKIETAIMSSKWHHVALLIGFVAELVNVHVLPPERVLNLFDQFMAIAEDSAASHARRDTFGYLVLHSIPMVYQKLNKENESTKAVVSRLSAYVASRPEQPVGFRDFSRDSSVNLIKLEHDAFVTWCEKDCPPYNSLYSPPPWQNFESRLRTGVERTLAPLRLPTPDDDKVEYWGAPTHLKIFEDQESNLETLLLRGTLVDCVMNFAQHRKDAARLLLHVTERASCSINLVTETLFGELFRLPVTRQRQLLYGSLVLELCKISQEFPPSLGRAINLLYHRMDTADIEVLHRFAMWFAYHLTNTDFRWDWSKWSGERSPQQTMFIQETLSHAVRLSYLQRVKESVPADFTDMLPVPPAPASLYPEDDTSPEAALSRQLVLKIRGRTPAEDILSFLKESSVDSSQHLTVFYSALLQCGHKTVSHMLVYLERYLKVLNEYVTDSSKQLELLQVIGKFWRASPQLQVLTIDRLMRYQVIENTSIVNWVFSPENLDLFSKAFIWEILFNAVDKTLARGKTIARDLAEARRIVNTANADDKATAEDRTQLAERVDQIQAAHERYKTQEKAMFLTVFQRFILALEVHMAKEGARTAWFSCTSARMLQLGRTYFHYIAPLLESMSEVLFREKVAAEVREAFEHVNQMQGFY